MEINKLVDFVKIFFRLLCYDVENRFFRKCALWEKSSLEKSFFGNSSND